MIHSIVNKLMAHGLIGASGLLVMRVAEEEQLRETELARVKLMVVLPVVGEETETVSCNTEICPGKYSHI